MKGHLSKKKRGILKTDLKANLKAFKRGETFITSAITETNKKL